MCGMDVCEEVTWLAVVRGEGLDPVILVMTVGGGWRTSGLDLDGKNTGGVVGVGTGCL